MRRVIMVALAALLGCSSRAPSNAGPGSQAAALGQRALDVAAASDDYRQAALSATTPAACQAALRAYLGRVEVALDAMDPVAAPVDAFLRDSGQAPRADVQCGLQVMEDELAHHAAVACGGADPGAALAEAQRHCDAMASFAQHMGLRAGQAGAGTAPPGASADAGPVAASGGAGLDDGPIAGCAPGPGGYQPPDGGYWLDGGWVRPLPPGDAGYADGGMPGGGGGGGMPGDGGVRVDGGMPVDAGVPGDGGVPPPAGDAGPPPALDGGTSPPLPGGAQACDPPRRCGGPMPMLPNFICPDGTLGGPACVLLPDGTCGWRILTCS